MPTAMVQWEKAGYASPGASLELVLCCSSQGHVIATGRQGGGPGGFWRCGYSGWIIALPAQTQTTIC